MNANNDLDLKSEAKMLVTSLLQREFDLRKIKNYSFSNRSFAKFLGLPQSTFANVMAGRQSLSRNYAQAISTKLGLSIKEAHLFITACGVSAERKSAAKIKAAAEFKTALQELNSHVVTLEEFSKVNQLHNQVILELLCIEDLDQSFENISHCLHIDRLIVEQSFEYLSKMKWIEFNDGKWSPAQRHTKVSSEVSNSSIRSFHMEVINKLREVITNGDTQKRVLGAVIFPIDSSRVFEMQKRLEEFRAKLTSEFECSTGDSVYCFSLQLFPTAHEIGKVTKC